MTLFTLKALFFGSGFGGEMFVRPRSVTLLSYGRFARLISMVAPRDLGVQKRTSTASIIPDPLRNDNAF
jgi:hypothetical protein